MTTSSPRAPAAAMRKKRALLSSPVGLLGSRRLRTDSALSADSSVGSDTDGTASGATVGLGVRDSASKMLSSGGAAGAAASVVAVSAAAAFPLPLSLLAVVVVPPFLVGPALAGFGAAVVVVVGAGPGSIKGRTAVGSVVAVVGGIVVVAVA